MRKIFALATLVALAATQATRADVTVPLLGDPAAMRGASFIRDPKTSELSTRWDSTSPKEKITVTLPGGKTINVNAGRATIENQAGWITSVSVGAGWNTPAAEAISFMDGFLNDNKLTLTDADQKKWAASKSDLKTRFEASLQPVNWVKVELECSFNADKADTTIRIFGASDGATEPTPLPAGGIALPFRVESFSPDSKTLTDGITFADLTGKQLGKVAIPNDAGYHLNACYTKDGKLVAHAVTKNKILLINTADYTLARTIDVTDLPAKAEFGGVLGFSPDGKTLYARATGTVFALNVEDGKQKFQFDKPSFQPGAMALSHDGKMLAMGSGSLGHSVALFNTEDGKPIKVLDANKLPASVANTQVNLSMASAVQFTADDKRLVGSGFMGTAKAVWTIASGDMTSLLLGYETQQTTLSPDGKLFLEGTWHSNWNPNGIYVFDAATNKVKGTVRPLNGVFSNTMFSPDGLYIIANRNSGGSLLFKTATVAALKPGPYVVAAAPASAPPGSTTATSTRPATAPATTTRPTTTRPTTTRSSTTRP